VSTRARFTDFSKVDKSASAAFAFDDVIFSKNVFICDNEDEDEDEDEDIDPYDCLFDSYTAHSSTL
jgi:hypothetical protein